jgi:hypothetical protein
MPPVLPDDESRIYRLWKEWIERIEPKERSTAVQEDFGDTSLPFEEWWASHQHLFEGNRYPLNGKITDKKIDLITKALAVYDAAYKNRNVLTYKLHNVGVDAQINEENIPKPTDGAILTKKKHAKLAADVARYLKSAECIKYYVARGVFPKTTYDEGDEPQKKEKRPPRIHDWLIR